MKLELTRKHLALAVLKALEHVLAPKHHEVLTFLYTNTEVHTIDEVCSVTGLTPAVARVTLKRLVDRELLDRVQPGVFQIPMHLWYHSN